MIYNVTLKGHVENLTSGQGHHLIRKGHVVYQSIRKISLNTYMVFSLLQLFSIKSYCLRIAGDLPWPFMTLATWRGVTGRNIPTQGVNSTCNPMIETMVFVQKRRQSWPDIGSPISKFLDIHLIHNVIDIKFWKFEGDRLFDVAMANIQTFSGVRSFDVTWWPHLEWHGSEIFTIYADKEYKEVCQKQRRGATLFFRHHLRKAWGECSNTPPPGAG